MCNILTENTSEERVTRRQNIHIRHRILLSAHLSSASHLNKSPSIPHKNSLFVLAVICMLSWKSRCNA